MILSGLFRVAVICFAATHEVEVRLVLRLACRLQRRFVAEA